MEHIAEFVVNESRLVDYSLDESYDDLNDSCDDDDCSSSRVLDQTLDDLRHHLASMQTVVADDVCCQLRSRVEFHQQVKNQQMRVSCVLEDEKDKEEQRKVEVIQNVVNTSKLLPRLFPRLDDSVFRRFSPRRVSLRGPAMSRVLRRPVNTVKMGKSVPKRQKALKFLLLSKKLCFKAME